MSISITSSTAGTIQYSGLTSDTNWVDLVDNLMEIERFTINRLNTWKQEWADKITCLQGLDSRLLILETLSGNMNAANEFYSRTSSSSDTEVLTVTNTSSATPGAHTVTVGDDIPHKLASQGWVDESSTGIGDSGSDFVINVGTLGTITIPGAQITSATTLEGLEGLINNPTYNPNDLVTASIIDDGSSANQYRLVITANSGGHEISITENPTNLNFNGNKIGPADNSSLTPGNATGTSLGNYTGTVSDASNFDTYKFTADANGTVGAGTLNLDWEMDKGSNTGKVSIGSDYTPGDTIEIEDGLFIQVSAGAVTATTESFYVNVFNMMDNVETGTWTGSSSVTSDGNYLGSTNKTFNFTVSGSGSVATDSFDVTWTDGEGNSGTINVTSSVYEDLAVYQGVEISFGAGTVVDGETFSIDVYNSTIQDCVSKGLAQVEVETHSGFTDEDTSYVTTVDGTFSYTYGGVTTTINVSADSTLSDLKGLINNDDDNPGVTASIINDGSGLSTAYHLQLTGNNSGAAYAIDGISHTLDSFANGGPIDFGFTETQKAQNAMIKVDGYPTDTNEYMQRGSNTIGDLINGVTMSLTGTGDAIISVTNDTNAIKSTIGGLVDSINSALDYIKAMTAYDEAGEGENNGVMIGNYGFQIVQQRINDILYNPVPGLTDGVDTYTRLSQIGISTDPDQNGKWVIDESTLNAALSNDIDAVCNLFVENDVTSVDGIAELVREETDKLTESYSAADPGIVSVLINNYEEIIDNIDSKIEREERRLLLVENRLNTKFTQLEVILGQLQGQADYLDMMLNSLPQIGGN